jgi:hypothetical protein
MIEPAVAIWAGGEVPGWLGLGLDFTERWVHQEQIREAVARPGAHRRFLPVVLSNFAWGFPHQYRPQIEVGAAVNVDFGVDARWHLFRRDHGWDLEVGLDSSPAAVISTDADIAWRQLTGALIPGELSPPADRHTSPNLPRSARHQHLTGPNDRLRLPRNPDAGAPRNAGSRSI